MANDNSLNFRTRIPVLRQQPGTLSTKELGDLALRVALIELLRVSAGMHHVLVIRQVVGLSYYVGYNWRMLRQERLIINFLPFELFGQLC